MQEISDVRTRVLLLKAKLREMQAVRNALNDDLYVVMVMIAKLEYAEARAVETQRRKASSAE
jgi:hypothetical protein